MTEEPYEHEPDLGYHISQVIAIAKCAAYKKGKTKIKMVFNDTELNFSIHSDIDDVYEIYQLRCQIERLQHKI